MAKINLDKYYTDIEIAKSCIRKTYDIIGLDNITEIIEPSAGNGSFSNLINGYSNYFKGCISYDIEPEQKNIIKQDFLKLHLPYKKGRLFIGNPPFGEKNLLAMKFYKHCVMMGDYIAFILPISQYNNNQQMFEFDLIYSEDLGMKTYTDRDLHCCFNIYRRPESGEYNPKPQTRLKDISIYRQDSNGYRERDFDLRMCYWGDGTAGKILKDGENYSAEYKIKINNDNIKNKIIETLTYFNWKEYLNCIAMRKIQQFHIVDVLRKAIPEIT